VENLQFRYVPLWRTCSLGTHLCGSKRLLDPHTFSSMYTLWPHMSRAKCMPIGARPSSSRVTETMEELKRRSSLDNSLLDRSCVEVRRLYRFGSVPVMHTRTHTHTHACMRTCTHIRMHATYKRAHACTRAHLCSSIRLLHYT
jgi:hypothetical protein